MEKTQFVYVSYIRTTPQRLWHALTDTEFSKQYWLGATAESEWTAGSRWQLRFEDGRIGDAGEILVSEPPRRLVIKWRNEWKPEFTAEGYSRCEFELEPLGDAVKLTITHSMDKAGARFINEGVSGGWPLIVSNLKSLLEGGEAVVLRRA